MVSNDSKTTPEVSPPDARAAKMVLAAHPVASRAKDENEEAQGRSGIVLRRPVTLGGTIPAKEQSSRSACTVVDNVSIDSKRWPELLDWVQQHRLPPSRLL